MLVRSGTVSNSQLISEVAVDFVFYIYQSVYCCLYFDVGMSSTLFHSTVHSNMQSCEVLTLNLNRS